MTGNRFFYFSLLMAGCTAAAFAVGRHTRQLEKKQQHKEDLHTWEDEGGNLAPSEPHANSAPRTSSVSPASAA